MQDYRNGSDSRVFEITIFKDVGRAPRSYSREVDQKQQWTELRFGLIGDDNDLYGRYDSDEVDFGIEGPCKSLHIRRGKADEYV